MIEISICFSKPYDKFSSICKEDYTLNMMTTFKKLHDAICSNNCSKYLSKKQIFWFSNNLKINYFGRKIVQNSLDK